jgi:uncharacterized protein (DUF488 family)
MADMIRRAAADGSRVCAVLTVGHSTRPIDEFVAMLVGHGVTVLVDVRTVPRSRHNPQFGDQALSERLAAEHIGYEQAAGLGGFRRTNPSSPNTGWRNLSFRGYADYMQTAEFAQELIGLIELAQDERVALMCAEAVPWRCHRSLIADALIAHGVTACEIVSSVKLRPHKLTPFARVVTRASGTWIDYPLEQP